MYEVRKITKKEENEDGVWMYLTEWNFYDDVTWETADTLRVGAHAKDVLNNFNKKRSRKYKPGPKSKRKRSDEHIARPSEHGVPADRHAPMNTAPAGPKK